MVLNGMQNNEISQPVTDTDEAVVALTEKIAFEPNNGLLYAARAEEFAKRGDFVTAARDYGCAINLLDEPLLFVKRAQLLFKLKQSKAALADCDRAIIAGANDTIAYYLKAEFYYENGDYTQALQICNFDKTACGKNIDLALLRAKCLEKMGMVEEAVAEMERFLIERGEQILVQLKLAELHYHLRHFDDTLKYANRVIMVDDDNVAALELKVHALFALGDYSGAAEVAGVALRLSPELAEMYFVRGHCMAQQSRFDEAIYNFSRAIEIEPNVSSGYRARADLYYRYKKYELAIKDYSRIISLEPEDISAHLKRGKAFLRVAKMKSALKDFSYAQMIDSTCGIAYYYKGVAYEKTSEKDKALAEYQKAKRFLHDDERVTDAVQRLLLQK